MLRLEIQIFKESQKLQERIQEWREPKPYGLWKQSTGVDEELMGLTNNTRLASGLKCKMREYKMKKKKKIAPIQFTRNT